LPAELYPFESRYLQVEGAWVHYVDEGSGVPAMMGGVGADEMADFYAK
jgi:hypothetical protein